MGRELLRAHLDAFEKIWAGLAGKRREGYDKQYEYSDAIKEAHGGIRQNNPSYNRVNK